MLSPELSNANAPAGRRAVVALAVGILAACVLHIFAVNYIADDGYISYRYADNLAHGHGLVYNVGERVEGYTNFLWVVLLATVRSAAPTVDLLDVARVAGTAATLLIIVLAFRLGRLLSLSPAVGLLAGAFLAAHSSLIAWAPAGLETSLFALLAFGGAVAFVAHLQTGQHLALSGALFAGAAMTRPDGVLFFGATGLAVLLLEWRRAGLKPAAVFAAGFAVIFVPYFLWRYSYYGDLFPNTAYAKVGPGLSLVTRGLRYVWNYVVQYGVFVWIVPVALFLLRRRDAWVWYFTGLIGLYLAYVIYVGGDGLAFHRFVAHVAPLIYFVAAAALVDVYQRWLTPLPRAARRAIATASIAAMLLLTAQTTLLPLVKPDRSRWFEAQSELWFPGIGTDHHYLWFDNYFVDRLAVAARYLERHAPPDSLVAATPAGSIGYHMHHRVLDMLGLTDKHIARTTDAYVRDGQRYARSGHEKGDGRYVLSREPDYILMGNVAVLPFPLDEKRMATKLVLKSEHELWDDPEFHERYELVNVRLADEGLFQYFSFYRRKGLAEPGSEATSSTAPRTTAVR